MSADTLLIRLGVTAATLAVLTLGACGPKEDSTAETAADPDGEQPTTSQTSGFVPDPDSATSSLPGQGTDEPGDPGGVTTDADDDTGNGFITPPDGGIAGECDPAAQDCPRGQKCSSYVSTPGGQTVDATHCVDVMGDDQWGEPCERFEGNDTCAPGFFCMTDVSGNTGEGICLEYCEIDQPCEYGGECFAFNDGALPICEVECHPLYPDCPPGQGCYAAFDSFVCATPGVSDGEGSDGDSCATIQGCQPGLLCKTGTAGCVGETGCCTPVCDLTEGDVGCTDAAESCLPALDDPPPGLEDAGYCGIPQ